jgi:diazepam-binding inhibitor (GABA receptor modulator, acyl-CoA-binding protein)
VSDLDAQFTAAQELSKSITERPSNDQLREIYGLYKQASLGDAETSGAKRPGRLDLVGRAKYDAWAGKKGLDSDTAKQQYVDLINGLAGRQV